MANANGNIHKDHRKRLRARYEKYGLASFEEHNILELLLFHSIPRADTNGIAHELINTFGSLYDVMCAPYEELLRVKGVGPASASLIRTVADTAREANLRKIASVPLDDYPRLAMYATEWFLGKQAGVVAVILLNDKNHIVHTETLSSSHTIRSASYAKTLETLASKHEACRMVLMHNHANGIMKPSDEDLYLTEQLYNILREKNITILEHLIVYKLDCLPILDQALHARVSGFPVTLTPEEMTFLHE
ncbi:MAG: RadC family protein [Clostridia bacterium]|nr:RadC family protein [Clostridia bacterium]